MSLIHCSCDCLYQHEGYCELEKAAEITNYTKADGCLHFIPSKAAQPKNKNEYKSI